MTRPPLPRVWPTYAVAAWPTGVRAPEGADGVDAIEVLAAALADGAGTIEKQLVQHCDVVRHQRRLVAAEHGLEFGHYLGARVSGIDVETFSIGFGRAICSWKARIAGSRSSPYSTRRRSRR